MKILLVNPPWETLDQHIYSTVGNVLPPLGIAYIAAVLRREGFDVDILDAQALNTSWEEFEKIISKRGPDLVGLTSGTPMIFRAFRAAEIVKKASSNTKVILGGPHPSVLPEESLRQKGVDFVVRGEGEYTILELAKELRKDKPKLSKIDGLSYTINKRVKHNKDRKPIMDLDALPRPARDLLPMDRYRATPGNHRREPATSMMSSRGCPFQCTYCAKPFGMRFRSHSPEYMITEMEELVEKYGTKEIVFFDDTFTFDKKRAERVCDMMAEKDWDLTFSCMARGDTIDRSLAGKMKKAGCQYIGFGIESVTPEILKNLKKGETVEKINQSIMNSRKVGLFVRGFYIIGSPGETPETIKRNIEHAKKMKIDLAQFSIITPFPGTELFNWAEKNGYLLTKDWRMYDCSEPIISLPNLKPEDLKYWYQRAFKEFYGRPGYILRQVGNIKTRQDLRRYTSTFFSLMKRWV